MSKFFSIFDRNEVIKNKAILDDDTIIEYDICHNIRLEKYDNNPDKFEYLGYGQIYEVRGVKQKLYHDEKYYTHFWRKLF